MSAELIEHIDTEIPYLKPCRTCGAESPRMLFGKKVGTDTDVYRIMCDSCGNNSEIYLNEPELIESWNKRLGGE